MKEPVYNQEWTSLSEKTPKSDLPYEVLVKGKPVCSPNRMWWDGETFCTTGDDYCLLEKLHPKTQYRVKLT